MSIDEAALYLRVTARALEHFRGEGGGPAYRKHGGSIVYHIHDLDRWSSLRRYSSTSKRADS
ncbi:MAG: helix-turn-helix domain-containing protein [Parvularculaceae bacterium]